MEYSYNLTLRPFDIGTYPRDNFLRYEEDGTQFGRIIYSQKVPINDASHFSLAHITEVEELDGKQFLWGSEYKWNISVEKNSRGVNFILATQFYEGEEVNKMPYTTAEFLRRVEIGDFTLIKEPESEMYTCSVCQGEYNELDVMNTKCNECKNIICIYCTEYYANKNIDICDKCTDEKNKKQ